ncbi:MAG: hypothetical protein OXU74_09545 [Gemmatimonadota bacterium]|nr:hypothetical protein [Gemmatimonadota bacterium]
MQGTKVVVWVLAVALAATALMFGASSLIRASGDGVDPGVVVERVETQQVTEDSSTEYERRCRRNQWEGITALRLHMELWDSQSAVPDATYGDANATELMRERENVRDRVLTMTEELAVYRVLIGDPWRDILSVWPAFDTPPTRRELAETTEWCVRELTPQAERWIAEAR